MPRLPVACVFAVGVSGGDGGPGAWRRVRVAAGGQLELFAGRRG